MTIDGEEWRFECAWCDEIAVCIVKAQWTIFDFAEDLACVAHVGTARAAFARRFVDGRPAKDVWAEWFDMPDQRYEADLDR
jgi:hypothetical protein